MEDLIDPLRGEPGTEIVQARGEPEILVYGQVFVEGAFLEDEADGPANHPRLFDAIVACDAGGPGRGPEQRAQHVNRRGLPGAVWSEEGEQLARSDLNVEPVHSGQLPKPFD